MYYNKYELRNYSENHQNACKMYMYVIKYSNKNVQ